MKKKPGSFLTLLVITMFLATCTEHSTPAAPPTPTASNPAAVPPQLAQAREKIKHIVIIMQENRSFDHYFGTYPGADGIPMQNGVPTVCANDPVTGQCIPPFHDSSDINYGGPHGAVAARWDINNGKMDGFVKSVIEGRKNYCSNPTRPGCMHGKQGPDAMGWHDAREIPNYWAYAQNFVLHDRMFEPSASWSLPAHLFMVSGWSAKCSNPDDPMSCVSNLENPAPGLKSGSSREDYAWTDLTYLMHKYDVSWGYYLTEGIEPDCADDQMFCIEQLMKLDVPGVMNPLPNFTTVHDNDQLGNIRKTEVFLTDLKNNKLPSVSWVIPENAVSEHPSSSVHAGQAYVTNLINAIMRSPDWNSTVIILAWDDWGGFYDHVVPPKVDVNGYGLRVPALLIGPYVKKGFIDHQTLSFDAYLKFIEDIFLDSQRIDPETDGRPDRRPSVRENVPQLGDLLNDFDFSQSPLPPLILSTDPPPGPASLPGTD